jgi:hypothetical protein
VQVPQFTVPPQPFGAVPQVNPVQAVAAGSGVQPHWLRTPAPPQVCGNVQLPQFSGGPPQPSEAIPQFCPAGHDVAGVQQAPPKQTCPLVHDETQVPLLQV